jgi:hypothetical protein
LKNIQMVEHYWMCRRFHAFDAREQQARQRLGRHHQEQHLCRSDVRYLLQGLVVQMLRSPKLEHQWQLLKSLWWKDIQ